MMLLAKGPDYSGPFAVDSRRVPGLPHTAAPIAGRHGCENAVLREHSRSWTMRNFPCLDKI